MRWFNDSYDANHNHSLLLEGTKFRRNFRRGACTLLEENKPLIGKCKFSHTHHPLTWEKISTVETHEKHREEVIEEGERGRVCVFWGSCLYFLAFPNNSLKPWEIINCLLLETARNSSAYRSSEGKINPYHLLLTFAASAVSNSIRSSPGMQLN